MPTSSTCYRIVDGKLAELAIPSGGLELRVGRQMTFKQPVVLAGEKHEEWAAFTLAEAGKIAARLTPWATWYAAPAKPDDAVRGTAHIK